jgi:hypothetical protein
VKIKDDKKPNQKRRKDNKTLSQKTKMNGKKLNKKTIKEKKPKIKFQTNELLAFTLLFKANLLVIHQFFKSLFTDSSQVKFNLPLSIFLLSIHLITPL